MVFVEPDFESAATEQFRELESRLHLRTRVTEKYVALARSLSRGRAHLA
jgi:hypothetical protein